MFPQSGRLVDWFSISHTYPNSLREKRASASIERLLTCPRKPPYKILLFLTSVGKKTQDADESVAAALRAPTRANKPQWTESRVGYAVRRVRPSNSSQKNCQALIAKGKEHQGKEKSTLLIAKTFHTSIDHRLSLIKTQKSHAICRNTLVVVVLHLLQ